jgi:hypothetical protein
MGQNRWSFRNRGVRKSENPARATRRRERFQHRFRSATLSESLQNLPGDIRRLVKADCQKAGLTHVVLYEMRQGRPQKTMVCPT